VNISPLSWADPGWAIAQQGWPRRRALLAERTRPQTDDLWQRAGLAPALDCNFAKNRSLLDDVSGRNLITFTRATTALYVDPSGELRTAAVNEPRFKYDLASGQCEGLLTEVATTNLLLNSQVLSTQSVTVSARGYTLSFTGTGSIALSGASTSGPLIGTGDGEINRVSLTFIVSTGGTLTLTVSGQVINAQLEANFTPTTYIPTAASSATRAQDQAQILGRNFLDFYNLYQGTLRSEWTMYGRIGGGDNNLSAGALVSNVFPGGNTDRMALGVFYNRQSGNIGLPGQVTASFSSGAPANGAKITTIDNTLFQYGVYSPGKTAGRATGQVAIPTPNRMALAICLSSAQLVVKRVTYWPSVITLGAFDTLSR